MIDEFPKAPDGAISARLYIDPAKLSLQATGHYLLATLLKLRDSGPHTHTVRIDAADGLVCIAISPAVFRQKESMN